MTGASSAISALRYVHSQHSYPPPSGCTRACRRPRPGRVDHHRLWRRQPTSRARPADEAGHPRRPGGLPHLRRQRPAALARAGPARRGHVHQPHGRWGTGTSAGQTSCFNANGWRLANTLVLDRQTRRRCARRTRTIRWTKGSATRGPGSRSRRPSKRLARSGGTWPISSLPTPRH